MDPPESPSSHPNVLTDATRKYHYPEEKPGTPKTTNTDESPTMPSKVIGQGTASNRRKSSTAASRRPLHHQPTPPLHRSRNAAKIIKGEIHNVLTVMRSDPRYYSVGGGSKGGDADSKRIQSRFEYEERQQRAVLGRNSGGGRFYWTGDWKKSTAGDARQQQYSGANTISSHPILRGLRDLHDLLSAVEVNGGSFGDAVGGSLQSTFQGNAIVTFVTPFAAAVQSRDVDAKTTGEALSAMHKFIVYGFIGGHDDNNEDYDAYTNIGFPLNSSPDKIRESISVVAQCIRHCSFESRTSSKSSSSKGMFSFLSSTGDNQQPILGQSDSLAGDESSDQLPTFLTQPRRSALLSKGKGGSSGSSSNRLKPCASFSPSDEDVVLKLLSLSVQVLRCPAGRDFLPPQHVLGIFDTCLQIAFHAGEANRSLLRSAAADALSHCVIVVFGMRRPSKKRGQGRDYHGDDDNTGDPTANDDVSDSDDDWGERDPTEEPVNDAMLVGKSALKREHDYVNISDNASATKPSLNTGMLKQEDEAEPALVAIMHRLATLADSQLHEDDTCVLALSLVNIALETMSDIDALSVRYPRLLTIMQNDLCRNLLRLSTSTDLAILGLTLRVIFNLFNSIKDHLKVQLEVFLTSVHLRTLSFSVPPNSDERVWSSPPERRELALESLLEFAREPMLMADLYLNYDCDINCTNLFETICTTLAKVANPENESVEQSVNAEESGSVLGGSSDSDDAKKAGHRPRLNILNRIALEGVLAVVDGIARRCRASSKYEEVQSDNTTLSQSGGVDMLSPPDSGNSAFLGNTLYIDKDSTDGSVLMNEASKYDFCNVSRSSIASKAMHERCDSELSEAEDMEWLSKARFHTALALRERKLRKRRMAKAAVEFNERTRDREWLEAAERIGVLPTPATPSSVASFLYATPKLDKAKIGLYLSKGPKEKYPFNNDVLEKFAGLFDFSGMSFSEALRTFLGRFRLPGEAQCIDRLMEAFAIRLYEVQLSVPVTENHDQSVEETMLDTPHSASSDVGLGLRSGTLDPPSASEMDSDDHVLPFKSSDAAFILSFSTIMLNTDLHNPNMKDEKRMTLDQFIRNNRGINDGSDLPIQFLTSLYHEIKNSEIQVNQDLLQEGNADAFDGILAKANDVATPFFTSNSNHQKITQAGIHERDMFVSISAVAIKAITTIFVESWDDVLVAKALDGLKNAAYICTHFELKESFNEILEIVLGFGLDYVGSVTTLMYTKPKINANPDLTSHSEGDDQTELVARGIPPLPKSFLHKLNQDSRSQSAHADINDMSGSSAHRGLLSLHCGLTLSKQHLPFINEAWPMLWEVMFALRDCHALPFRLSELDDFADCRGNPLPMSIYANQSRERVDTYLESIAPSDQSDDTGFLSSMFSFGQSSSSQGKNPNNSDFQKLFPLSKILLAVSESACLDKIIMKTGDVAMAKRILFAMLGSMPPVEDDEETASDPLFEHNSVLVLELAARLLISNRDHASELYPLFLHKFQQLISAQTDGSSEGNALGLKFPYLLERIVVTILRACIHLFDVPESSLRSQLNRSLNLVASLPSSYLSAINGRVGCGAAIILRGCFYLFDDNNDDWSTIKCLLDLAAQDASGRGFVFDGIASVIDGIDYALPSANVDQVLGNGETSDVQLSQCGVDVIASLLLKFMNGGYEGDMSFKVPAMAYINNVYSFSQHFSNMKISDNESANNAARLQENEFEKMVAAIYHDACLATDSATAKKGFESLQGVVMSTKVDSIPVEKWFDFLDLVASKPPDIACQEARAHSLSLIGRLFLTLMPDLSNRKENWSKLEDWTISVASLVGDNLQAGRASPLFETTVQTVTNVVNVMQMSGFNDGEGVNFCSWVGETLLYELEKVGASGSCAALASTPSKPKK